jgi:cell division protein FtsL
MKAVAVMAVLSLLLLYVWERVDIVRVGYQIEQLKSKKVAVQRDGDELHVKVSALTSPERIARAATDKLGMMPPQQGQIIIVRAEAAARDKAVAASTGIRLARNENAGRMP